MTDSFVILNFAEARQPEYREKKGQGYVEFGDRNDYPDYLLALFNKSAKQNAIIKGKVNYITGNGWKAAEGDLVADAFIRQPNPSETLAELTRKVSMDIEIFGGAYLEVIWSRVGGKLVSVSHIDYTKIRTTTDNTSFFYKKDWTDRRGEVTAVPAFNTSVREGRQILYIKEYRPGLDAYALPGYMGSLNYIESDIEVSKHVLGNAQTGFSASKLITLPNGEPSPDEKRIIDSRFRDNFSGADGKKFMLSFVTDPTRKPMIDDLGASDLTKEDFGRVDSMIQQNIFAGHQLTSPALFGIAEPGKLGTRSELRDAYEIFKNTYVSDKQQHLEQVFNRLAEIKGAQEAITIIPVEPITFELSETAIMTVAPKEWILEKAGIDMTKYGLPAPVPGQIAPANPAEASPVNENLKNLTGRQWQQVMRIVRQYGQGKITRDIAQTMLRSGLGMGDDDIAAMLGEVEEFGADMSEDDVIAVFGEYGEVREMFDVVENRRLRFADVEDETDKAILSILQRQPLTPVADVAKALRIDVSEADRRITGLIERKVLVRTEKGGIKPTRPVSDIVDEPSKLRYEIRYSYEWKPEVPESERDTAEHPSRPFCKKMMSLDRFWNRREIESISLRLGYSVFDRAGGWWGQGAGQPASPSCRHEWRSNVLIRRK
jgi:DNA-binding Lrp family transcriptional regulator